MAFSHYGGYVRRFLSKHVDLTRSALCHRRYEIRVFFSFTFISLYPYRYPHVFPMLFGIERSIPPKGWTMTLTHEIGSQGKRMAFRRYDTEGFMREHNIRWEKYKSSIENTVKKESLIVGTWQSGHCYGVYLDDTTVSTYLWDLLHFFPSLTDISD